MTSCNIFDIKRYAINDGPGIRTTIFLKGCPLRCVWCHNPEGWLAEQQRIYKKTKCIGCQSCVEVCPQHALELTPNGIKPTNNECVLCGKCTEACPTTALEMCGREWPLDELMAEIEKERDIMQDSGGGITLCGGEPLMHAEYIQELLRELGRRGFHRTIDTTLYAPWHIVEQVSKLCELWLIDLKLMDADKHRRFTGVDNSIILQNIQQLAQTGADFFIRIPLIKGINTDEENILQTAQFISSLPWQRRTVNLLPYHDVGKDKHHRMWSRYNPDGISMETPSDDTVEHCAHLLEASGINVIIGG